MTGSVKHAANPVNNPNHRHGNDRFDYNTCIMIKAVLFDFGGVVSDEGFRGGLHAIAEKNALDPGAFYETACEEIFTNGYVVGKAEEDEYWAALRRKTGIRGTDRELREEILSRFSLRPAVLHWVDSLRDNGIIVCILSDQTNWLDEIDVHMPFSHRFDLVFNSFHLGKSKRDSSVFRDVSGRLGVRPDKTLFVDDNEGNIMRAQEKGLRTILYTNEEDFAVELKRHLDGGR